MRALLTCANILIKSLNFPIRRSISKMAVTQNKEGFSLGVVVQKLTEFAPAPLAEKWDNTGLLMEPFTPKIIQKILLTNDLTEDVMVEAVDLNVDMIISYHPPIFSSLKSVSQRTWKERVVSQCLENRIAVYSPHTSWDAVVGGVNDWLASALPEHSRSPVTPGLQDSTTGCGRICILKSDVALSEAVELVKKRCGLNHVRLALARGASPSTLVSKVAICAGSGATLLRGVPAQLYITGEMLHHDVLDAVHNGASVILTNHSDSERGFLQEFKPILSQLLENQVQILISEKDKDPLVTV